MILSRASQVLLIVLAPTLLARSAAAIPKVAIIGAGVGGTAAAHFLRSLQPSWHLELFERDRIGGRTQELFYDGKTLELGASIIHAQNQYVLSLAKQMGLTPIKGDDTGTAFSIYDGNQFVFKQVGSQVLDMLAVLKRYGVTPLRYKWLSEEMGRRFARIYDLQKAGHAYTSPQAMWEALGLFNVTQQSAAAYMQDHLTHGWFKYGSGYFIEELAAAINRINYNQPNQVMNALAGLVSYLPAAQPEVYSIQEGNAALPRKLASASDLQVVHVGVAVQTVQRDASGQYTVLATAPPASSVSSTTSTDGIGSTDDTGNASNTDDASTTGNTDSAGSTAEANTTGNTVGKNDADTTGSTGNTAALQEPQTFGPYDAIILATPLEGNGIDLQGVLPPGKTLPKRAYQSTVTTYVTGTLNPKYFKVESLPSGDIFVSNSARTPFSVIASKGSVAAHACVTTQPVEGSSCCSNVEHHANSGQQSNSRGSTQQQQQQQNWGQEERQLWKVFSEEPLSSDLLQQLFVGGEVVISKAWKAYPRFHPPEGFAPFTLAPGFCYNNALENGASAMEISTVAAMNCALLVQQALSGVQHTGHTASAASAEGVATT